MNDDKIIAALNELIEASKDGEQELTRAAEDAAAPEIVRVCSDAEEANRVASAELQDQVRLLGGTAEDDGSLKASARRRWTSMKSMVRARDDGTIMEDCERGQRFVRSCYEIGRAHV